MSRKSAVLSTVFMVVLTLASAGYAQRGAWICLGNAHVDGGSDHDKVKVDRSETFRALQLGVTGTPVGFGRLVVHYGNGTEQQALCSRAEGNQGPSI